LRASVTWRRSIATDRQQAACFLWRSICHSSLNASFGFLSVGSAKQRRECSLECLQKYA